MIYASKILVPSDFSEASQEALDYAVQLGTRLGAEVDVIHVWEPPSSTDAEGDLLTEFVRSDAGHKMLDILGGLEERSLVEAHGRVAPGARRDVPDAIVDAVENGHYDLVVMATHGRDRFSLVLRRGVADEVIRRAGCPVVTVRTPAPPPPSIDPPTAVSYPW